MFDLLKNLDRRWIFLAMLLATTLPIIFQKSYPEIASPPVKAVFDAVEELPEGSKVMIAIDYDPPSEGELKPMTTAFVRHLCERKMKIYFIALWPVGVQIIEDAISDEIKKRYPELVYGQDYVNLGFKAGNEGVIKVIVSDLKKLFTTDQYGTNIDDIELTKTIKTIRDMDLMLNVGAGYPGPEEWIKYAITPYKIKYACGTTGVQAPRLYTYYPQQMLGVLGAIKGAAEYEALFSAKYTKYAADEFNQGRRRMSPQLWAHILVMSLIVLGNLIYFFERGKGDRR